jgi:trehalose 6-phosphate phosphatase
MAAMVADQAVFQLLEGAMTWEIRPVGADKGRAVDVVMRRDPFAGRTPIFIGDDVTDEDGMRVARAMGGFGLRVDRYFGTPGGVRHWLALAATSGIWPPLPGEDA